MSACPDRERISAWLRGGLEDAELARHVEQCELCARRARRARADGELLADLRVVAGSERELVARGYRIEGELRRGGQGIVYRATQEATRRAVALKVLAAGYRATERERRRFEREIELASRLRHPFVVTVFDSGLAVGEPWYAMELLEGRPLDEWARASGASLRQRLELFGRVCSAVAYAHRRGVIHRDLKPANVLVDADGVPRVLDFGAARDLDDPALVRVTGPGEFLGTLAYAAPEQLRAAAGEIDTRTDVYALGLVLYELVAGRLPFETGASVAELVESRERDVPPPSRYAPGIDRELDALVLRALAREPDRRYGSAEALERDLFRYLAGEPLEARPPSAGRLVLRALAKQRAPLLAGAAVLAVLGAGGAAWWREREHADRQREQVALVRSVFQDLLGAAAPQRMGPGVRLLDVFELAARNVDTALAGAPDVQAEVELTIGDTYRRLLRAEEALPHLRRALERFEEVDDGRELEVARAANLLGLALSQTNDPEAVLVQERALAIRERELEPGDPLIDESKRSLAIALLERFRDAEALRARDLLESALAGFRATLGDDHPQTAETKLWRARGAFDLSPVEVGRLLSEAASAFEHGAPDDQRAIDCFSAYSTWLLEMGRFDEARAWLDRSAATARRLFGDELATDALRGYARLELARGDAGAAEQLSRQAIAHELEIWAERRPEEDARLRALAQRVVQPGPPNAEPPYGEAFAALRGFAGDGAFELAQWINGVAQTLRAQDRLVAAAPMLREALAIRCRAMGADCPIRQQTIELSAEASLASGGGGDAVPLLEESLATFARNGEDTSEEARRAHELLASCRSQGSRGTPP